MEAHHPLLPVTPENKVMSYSDFSACDGAGTRDVESDLGADPSNSCCPVDDKISVCVLINKFWVYSGDSVK